MSIRLPRRMTKSTDGLLQTREDAETTHTSSISQDIKRQRDPNNQERGTEVAESETESYISTPKHRFELGMLVDSNHGSVTNSPVNLLNSPSAMDPSLVRKLERVSGRFAVITETLDPFVTPHNKSQGTDVSREDKNSLDASEFHAFKPLRSSNADANGPMSSKDLDITTSVVGSVGRTQSNVSRSSVTMKVLQERVKEATELREQLRNEVNLVNQQKSENKAIALGLSKQLSEVAQREVNVQALQRNLSDLEVKVSQSAKQIEEQQAHLSKQVEEFDQYRNSEQQVFKSVKRELGLKRMDLQQRESQIATREQQADVACTEVDRLRQELNQLQSSLMEREKNVDHSVALSTKEKSKFVSLNSQLELQIEESREAAIALKLQQGELKERMEKVEQAEKSVSQQLLDLNVKVSSCDKREKAISMKEAKLLETECKLKTIEAKLRDQQTQVHATQSRERLNNMKQKKLLSQSMKSIQEKSDQLKTQEAQLRDKESKLSNTIKHIEQVEQEVEQSKQSLEQQYKAFHDKENAWNAQVLTMEQEYEWNSKQLEERESKLKSNSQQLVNDQLRIQEWERSIAARESDVETKLLESDTKQKLLSQRERELATREEKVNKKCIDAESRLDRLQHAESQIEIVSKNHQLELRARDMRIEQLEHQLNQIKQEMDVKQQLLSRDQEQVSKEHVKAQEAIKRAEQASLEMDKLREQLLVANKTVISKQEVAKNEIKEAREREMAARNESEKFRQSFMELQDRIKGMTVEHERSMLQLEDSKSSLHRDAAQLERAQTRVADLEESLSHERKLLASERASIEQDKQNSDAKRQELFELQSKHNEQCRVEHAKLLEKEERLAISLSEVKQQREDLQAGQRRLAHDVNELDVKRSTLNQREIELHSKQSKLEDEQLKLAHEKQLLAAKASELKQQEKEAEQREARVRECEQQVAGKEEELNVRERTFESQLLAKYEVEKAELEQKVSAQVTKFETRRELFEEEMTTWRREQEEFQNEVLQATNALNDERRLVRELREEYEEKLDSLKHERSSLEQRMDQVHQHDLDIKKAFSELENQQLALEQARDEIENKIKEFEFVVRDTKSKQDHLMKMESDLASREESVASKEAELKLNAEKLESLHKKLTTRETELVVTTERLLAQEQATSHSTAQLKQLQVKLEKERDALSKERNELAQKQKLVTESLEREIEDTNKWRAEMEGKLEMRAGIVKDAEVQMRRDRAELESWEALLASRQASVEARESRVTEAESQLSSMKQTFNEFQIKCHARIEMEESRLVDLEQKLLRSEDLQRQKLSQMKHELSAAVKELKLGTNTLAKRKQHVEEQLEQLSVEREHLIQSKVEIEEREAELLDAIENWKLTTRSVRDQVASQVEHAASAQREAERLVQESTMQSEAQQEQLLRSLQECQERQEHLRQREQDVAMVEATLSMNAAKVTRELQEAKDQREEMSKRRIRLRKLEEDLKHREENVREEGEKFRISVTQVEAKGESLVAQAEEYEQKKKQLLRLASMLQAKEVELLALRTEIASIEATRDNQADGDIVQRSLLENKVKKLSDLLQRERELRQQDKSLIEQFQSSKQANSKQLRMISEASRRLEVFANKLKEREVALKQREQHFSVLAMTTTRANQGGSCEKVSLDHGKRSAAVSDGSSIRIEPSATNVNVLEPTSNKRHSSKDVIRESSVKATSGNFESDRKTTLPKKRSDESSMAIHQPADQRNQRVNMLSDNFEEAVEQNVRSIRHKDRGIVSTLAQKYDEIEKAQRDEFSLLMNGWEELEKQFTVSDQSNVENQLLEQQNHSKRNPIVSGIQQQVDEGQEHGASLLRETKSIQHVSKDNTVVHSATVSSIRDLSTQPHGTLNHQVETHGTSEHPPETHGTSDHSVETHETSNHQNDLPTSPVHNNSFDRSYDSPAVNLVAPWSASGVAARERLVASILGKEEQVPKVLERVEGDFRSESSIDEGMQLGHSEQSSHIQHAATEVTLHDVNHETTTLKDETISFKSNTELQPDVSLPDIELQNSMDSQQGLSDSGESAQVPTPNRIDLKQTCESVILRAKKSIAQLERLESLSKTLEAGKRGHTAETLRSLKESASKVLNTGGRQLQKLVPSANVEDLVALQRDIWSLQEDQNTLQQLVQHAVQQVHVYLSEASSTYSNGRDQDMSNSSDLSNDNVSDVSSLRSLDSDDDLAASFQTLEDTLTARKVLLNSVHRSLTSRKRQTQVALQDESLLLDSDDDGDLNRLKRLNLQQAFADVSNASTGGETDDETPSIREENQSVSLHATQMRTNVDKEQVEPKDDNNQVQFGGTDRMQQQGYVDNSSTRLEYQHLSMQLSIALSELDENDEVVLSLRQKLAELKL